MTAATSSTGESIEVNPGRLDNHWEAGIRKVIDYPLEWFYGYGTKPLNAFLFSLGIIIIFGGFWGALGLGGPKDRTKEGLKEGEEWLDGDIADILGFSVTVFLSGTKFLLSHCHFPKGGHSRSLIKKAFVLEGYEGRYFRYYSLSLRRNDSESNLSEGS